MQLQLALPAGSLHHSFQLRTDGGLSLSDCLRTHLFEQPKYVPPSDIRVITDPVEQCLYFFRRADKSTAEELVFRFPDPVLAEATGVLEMIAKDPEERRLCNARLKLERDKRARKLQAQEEGIAEGFQLGWSSKKWWADAGSGFPQKPDRIPLPRNHHPRSRDLQRLLLAAK